MIKIKILQNDSGQRIDKFLRKLLDKSSLSLIFKLIRTNQIKLNNKKVKNNTILKCNDELIIYVDDNKLKSLSTVLFLDNKNNCKNSNQNDDIISYIDKITLYKDNDILILNKPPNIIVHPGGKWDIKDTLIFKIHKYFKINNSLVFKPTFVHRLDRETSGAIIVALSMYALQDLSKQIKNRILKKNYISLVYKNINIKSLLDENKIQKHCDNWYKIEKSILKVKSISGYNNPEISDDTKAQNAITYFKIIKYIYGCTLCEIQLETGRMHQIRLHMTYLGHPVVGDSLYGDKKINKFFLQNYNLNRQFLHASSVKFIHPITKKEMEIKAPLTKDLLFV